jgi:hypothetical protein
MAKLNQIIAIEKGIKAESLSEISKLYKAVQKPELFNGFHKTYAPVKEDGETLPTEGKRVQYNANEALAGFEHAMSQNINITARKDYTNCVSSADVTVHGITLIKGAPVSFLLFMEKQLVDLRTFVAALPLLDAAEDWKFDPNSGIYKTEVTKTHRTKKEQKPIVMYGATVEHPAQTQMITEDVLAGYWSLVKHSGAVPKPYAQELLERIDAVLRAVKEAREEANMRDEVEVDDIGQSIFNYLLPK